MLILSILQSGFNQLLNRLKRSHPRSLIGIAISPLNWSFVEVNYSTFYNRMIWSNSQVIHFQGIWYFLVQPITQQTTTVLQLVKPLTIRSQIVAASHPHYIFSMSMTYISRLHSTQSIPWSKTAPQLLSNFQTNFNNRDCFRSTAIGTLYPIYPSYSRDCCILQMGWSDFVQFHAEKAQSCLMKQSEIFAIY